MNIIRTTLILGVFSIFFSSCGIFDSEEDADYFQIKVDSLYLPDSVSINDNAEAHVFGYIGPDGCYMISHFENVQTDEGIALTVWGKHVHNITCTFSLVGLDDMYRFNINRVGYYKVKILNPHNQFILDSIYVY